MHTYTGAATDDETIACIFGIGAQALELGCGGREAVTFLRSVKNYVEEPARLVMDI